MACDNENCFKPLAGNIYELFEACRDAGFDNMQAFELTKTYCSVAFVNLALARNEENCAGRLYSWRLL